ncbi:MAG TPA: EAL domain-containing protein [Tepidisphaeraceae bacterium]|jgi:diguanylate cyclase (GGDEF)-like protein/PAS domain S-box-containing protein|nr:EAL domain-containing protein [Tepidisphaeraceae bacterium]
MPDQKLLVIDDSSDVHELVGVWLIDEPIELLAAYDATSGQAIAREHKPDLILLDVDMPGTNGFELCAQLKANPLTQQVPVVFLTGASTSEEKLRGLDLGAADYIVKPFEPAELRARVRVLLRTQQLLALLAQKATVLEESEARFRVLAENSSDVISRHDADGTYLYVSPACEAVLGYAPDEMIGRRVYEYVHVDDVYAVATCHTDPPSSANGTRRPTATFRFRRKDGAFVWLESTFRPHLRAEDGTFEVHGSARDITARKHQERIEQCRIEVLERVAQNCSFEDVMGCLLSAAEQVKHNAVAGSIALFDGQLHYATEHLPPSVQKMFVAQPYAFAARICSAVANASGDVFVSDIATDPMWDGARDALLAEGFETCWASLIDTGREVLGAFCLYHRDPAQPDAVQASFLRMAGKLAALTIEHHQLTEQLAHRAQHDALTGLPNRVLFEERLQRALVEAARVGRSVTVAFIDVDRFKQINDTLGHHVGDQVLCQVATRVQAMVGPNDTLARMGGDEFAMILTDSGGPEAAERLCRQIIARFKTALDVLGQELIVTLSIGLATAPTDASDSTTLKKSADAALYAVKRAGRDGVQCFVPSMMAGGIDRWDMEVGLTRAIDAGELVLHYQPQVNHQGNIVGLEALVRWMHPRLGMVPPNRFIPIAEETGLIIPIGNWVLREALEQCRRWTQAGVPCVPVAVNVSALQFAQPLFPSQVDAALRDFGIDAGLLKIEVTESSLMRSMQDAAAKLTELRAIGIGLAIDDFGTGYSSLAYLHRLPIDVLKIDRTFVSAIGTSRSADADCKDTTITRAIIELARSLGLSTVAEGVETELQRATLKSLGCDVMQGYLFSKPIPVEPLRDLLCRGRVSRVQDAAVA